MYAIIETGGKQYRVEEGDVLDVEKLGLEAGEKIAFDSVLFLHDGTASHIGAPKVDGCTVEGEILGDAKGPKISSIKYKRRKNAYRRFGHRQGLSRVKITMIHKK